MRALALIEEPVESRETWQAGDRPRRPRLDARLARQRLVAARGDVDVDAVATALVRRLAFTAALHAQLTDEA